MRISCPICGERDRREFYYQGAAVMLDRPAPDAGFALWAPLVQTVALTWAGERFDAQVRVIGPDHQMWEITGSAVDVTRRSGRWWCGDIALPPVHVGAGCVTVFDAYGLEFGIIDPLARAAEQGGDAGVIEAPMPGLVTQMLAKAGQEVQKGDRLAVLEAMKMEHVLTARRDGTVAEVLAAEGAQVAAGAALIRLAPEGD